MGAETFTCPMHPHVREPAEGSCPECGMDLVPADEARGMAMREPMAMMAREHYTPYRWVQAAVAGLGLWLIASPVTFGYESRALWISDIASGIAVLGLAILALGRTRGWASWAVSVVGVWLLGAPLLFWAPTPVAFLNDSLVGVMLIVFGFLIPMGMKMQGADVPPGWSYNPSTWPQRAPMIGLALVGYFLSRYMAAYQLGYIPAAWDPFFEGGTRRVLESEVSRAWPVSDAGLGAMTYMLEALMGLMGDKRRWRTMPWMVAGFGLIVVPLGLVSIALIIMQPLVVGAWCTLCLVTAGLMLLMIPLALDEVVAMVQFVRQERRRGVPAWHTFWYGGNLADDEGGQAPAGRAETWRPRGMLWGISLHLPLVLAAALGVWLMFAPAVLGSTGAMADSSHLVGAIVVVVSVIALAEVARPGRFLNLLLGAWLLVGPWFLGGGSTIARLNAPLVGVLVILLSLPLGPVHDRYGSYDRLLRLSPRSRGAGRRRPWGREAPAH